MSRSQSTRPGPSERRSTALRSMLIQGAWNYETLQGVGFAWAILPGLRRLYPDPAARRRRIVNHLGVFNSNPYMSTLAMGVALRIEAEVGRGAVGADARLTRLLSALRGPLGAIGDDVFWASLRPALGLVGTVFAIATGGPWVAGLYLLAFNGLAQVVRFRGVRAGYTTGAGVVRVLQDPVWRRWSEGLKRVGAVAVGGALAIGFLWSKEAAGDAWGTWIFLATIVLFWLAGRRVGSERRWLPPSLAYLAVTILLSVLYQLMTGARFG